MAYVKFLPPLTKRTTVEKVQIDAKNVRELCKELIDMFHLEKSLLLTDSDKLTSNIVLLVNRRNAHILEGADTEVNEETEILIMQFLVGG